MKEAIYRRYKELLGNEESKKVVLAVLQEDRERTQKAFREVYRLFGDMIESDLIENIITLAVAYIIEEEI